jgi:enamine deaminase RidA (YjgF/YER057c/UK114 family)
MKVGIRHKNPEGLIKNRAFSQAVITQGSGKTIYIGGQNAVNSNYEVVGKGDIALQTDQVMKNLLVALSDCGATMENVVKLNIYIVQGQDVRTAFQASQKYMPGNSNPPAVTGLFVAALGHPDYLVEVDAVAFVAE